MIILCADGTAAIDAILAVLQHSGRLSAKSSKLWEKLIVAWWKFDGLSFEDNRRIPCRMLKMARLLTRPTLARRDAPYPVQGRNSAADPRFTFHGSWEQSENEAGGLFQHPAKNSTRGSTGSY